MDGSVHAAMFYARLTTDFISHLWEVSEMWVHRTSTLKNRKCKQDIKKEY